MNKGFAKVIESLHPSFEKLLNMEPVTTSTLPSGMPSSGVYLFKEGKDYLYVGRSNRLRSRIRRHGVENATHNVAAFAFRIAREATGNTKASYKPEGSRKDLVRQPVFARAFSDAKARVRNMEARFVEEPDQLRQCVLEIYVAVVLSTPFNDFGTH